MSEPLPPDDVHVRLGVSAIHGIGVFAGEIIAVGSNFPANFNPI